MNISFVPNANTRQSSISKDSKPSNNTVFIQTNSFIQSGDTSPASASWSQIMSIAAYVGKGFRKGRGPMIDYKKILEVCEKATPGPWKNAMANCDAFPTVVADSRVICGFGRIGLGSVLPEINNADFIVLARTVLPELVQRCITLEEENERLQKCYKTTNESWKELQEKSADLKATMDIMLELIPSFKVKERGTMMSRWNELEIECQELRDQVRALQIENESLTETVGNAQLEYDNAILDERDMLRARVIELETIRGESVLVPQTELLKLQEKCKALRIERNELRTKERNTMHQVETLKECANNSEVRARLAEKALELACKTIEVFTPIVPKDDWRKYYLSQAKEQLNVK
jgi:hypothetical protein